MTGWRASLVLLLFPASAFAWTVTPEEPRPVLTVPESSRPLSVRLARQPRTGTLWVQFQCDADQALCITRSDDEGATWTAPRARWPEVGPPIRGDLFAYWLGEKFVIASHVASPTDEPQVYRASLFFSPDMGAWTAQEARFEIGLTVAESPLPFPHHDLAWDQLYRDPKTGWIFALAGIVPEGRTRYKWPILYSTDEGRTFRVRALIKPPKGVNFVGTWMARDHAGLLHWIVSSQGGDTRAVLYSSADDGLTWTPTPIPSVEGVPSYFQGNTLLSLPNGALVWLHGKPGVVLSVWEEAGWAHTILAPKDSDGFGAMVETGPDQVAVLYSIGPDVKLQTVRVTR